MKILYIVKTNRGASWAYRQVEWIKKHKEGFEFTIVMPSENGGYADRYKEIGCKVIASDFSLPVKKPWTYIRKKKAIKNTVEQEKPDIIHSHFVTTTLMIRLAMGRTPPKRIFQVPGPLHLENAFFRFLDKKLANDQDYWIGTCQWTVDKYTEMGIPRDRVFLDYYGTEIPPVYSGTMKLHEDLHISEKEPIVGMVSYFYKPKYYLFQFRGIKGHEDFIEAIASVRKTHPDVKGVIIGNAWDGAQKYEKKIHALAERKCPGGIIFAGYRDDVRNIYHEMAAAVHPSLSENLGGAGQSISQYVPTISTNVGGFPDVVKNGITGWTVNPHNPDEIADRVIWCLEHREEAQKMSMKGRKLYEQLLSIDQTAEKLTEIYKTVEKA